MKIGHQNKGKNHKLWKNGINFTINNGYIYRKILRPGYFSSDSKGYVLEHVYNFQEFHKCCMLKGGIVHHRDGDTLNNKISNLEGMLKPKHNKIHRIGKFVDTSKRVCLLCNSNKTYIKKNGRAKWNRYKDGWICDICRAKIYYRNKSELK